MTPKATRKPASLPRAPTSHPNAADQTAPTTNMTVKETAKATPRIAGRATSARRAWRRALSSKRTALMKPRVSQTKRRFEPARTKAPRAVAARTQEPMTTGRANHEARASARASCGEEEDSFERSDDGMPLPRAKPTA